MTPVLTSRAGRAQPLGASESEADRVRMAARKTTTAAMLCTLACDPAPTVRAAVALNPTFAAEADRHLVHDADERVRCLLATKMARLLPGLSRADQAAAQAHVEEMLRALATDAAACVRTAIAQALTGVVDAPHDVIITLAHDPVLAVSEPIVRFSPLLTDADLLGLLATPPHGNTAVAVAGRVGLSAAVADAIAEHADSAAVAALLSNPSATIQEATLDSLIGQASEHPDWHEPLVGRPLLPERSIRALAMIVAGNVLEALMNRADIPEDLAADVRELVAQNLSPPPRQTEAEILADVRRLREDGHLTEAALLDAAAGGDVVRTFAMLVTASEVPPQHVQRAVSLRSGKALVSLVHRAGFSMRAGAVIQRLLGRLSPSEILTAAPDGSYPLSVSEMDWQVELLSQPGL
jgi:uncharacterized protein (DUF2336 family)